MTSKKAIYIGKNINWNNYSSHEKALYQLNHELMCMGFTVFHEAVEESVGYPVWNHEFGSRDKCEKMIAEIEKKHGIKLSDIDLKIDIELKQIEGGCK